MRKNIEDLHISVTEKDAEIIKLRMQLGDEKAKANQRLRPASSSNSLARLKSQESSPSPTMKFKRHNNNDANQLPQRDQHDSDKALRKEMTEMQQNHLNEIKTL